MNVQLITKEELDLLKSEIINEIKQLLTQRPSETGRGKWMKSREAMAELGCSESKLQRLRIRREIEFKKVGGTYYYKLDVQC